jgi:hypothetical protein
MIRQRLVADLGTSQGRLTIETNPEDPNSLAELINLREELALRVNVTSEGNVITQPPIEDIPPPPVE